MLWDRTITHRMELRLDQLKRRRTVVMLRCSPSKFGIVFGLALLLPGYSFLVLSRFVLTPCAVSGRDAQPRVSDYPVPCQFFVPFHMTRQVNPSKKAGANDYGNGEGDIEARLDCTKIRAQGEEVEEGCHNSQCETSAAGTEEQCAALHADCLKLRLRGLDVSMNPISLFFPVTVSQSLLLSRHRERCFH